MFLNAFIPASNVLSDDSSELFINCGVLSSRILVDCCLQPSGFFDGLQEKIKLVPIDLQNRPAWYKEKVYPANKVPALEYNNEVKGESLDLIKFIDENFEGPKLLPDDPAKKQFADEFFSYSDIFNSVNYFALSSKGDVPTELDAAYDKLEKYLAKFDDGPFFLGQFSLMFDTTTMLSLVPERYSSNGGEIGLYILFNGQRGTASVPAMEMISLSLYASKIFAWQAEDLQKPWNPWILSLRKYQI